jgi:hypothetical protein
VKKPEEVMAILEDYDLAGTPRGAAQLAGCDHMTVAHNTLSTTVSIPSSANSSWARLMSWLPIPCPRWPGSAS